MIFLLGATGYVGKAFDRGLTRLKLPFRSLSRAEIDYSNFKVLLEALKAHQPKFVINAAGFTGKPNVDACETQRSETILGNIVLTQTVAEACEASGTRLGCVASGCIYTGAKIEGEDGAVTTFDDLNAPEVQKLLQIRSSKIKGFTEEDRPNFTFEQNNCSFYSGTKAVGERILSDFPETYVWRLRIPFNEHDDSRNYLSKIQRYPKVYQNWNSISHLGDFVSACLQTWQMQLPGGFYNVVNPGYVSTREVVDLVRKKLRPDWNPEFWKDDAEFYRTIAKAPRSNCLLDTTKLLASGVKIRPIDEAIDSALANWQSAASRP
jgi:dTDP-4-dehydrorhamnose reductase